MISNAYSEDAVRAGWVPSGVPTLDSLLGGGLALGDNIVWIGESSSETEPFVDAFQSSATADVRCSTPQVRAACGPRRSRER